MDRSYPLRWPSHLLVLLEKHQHCVEDPVNARVPPSNDKTCTVSDFFQDSYSDLVGQMASRGAAAEVCSSCISLLYEMIEQSSLLSLLSPKERKHFQASQHFDKKSTILAKNKTSKRRRSEDLNTLNDYKFSRVLPVEYLLRFLFALPHVIEHYNRLSGSEIPSYADENLWVFTNLVLDMLGTKPDLFAETEAYVPLR
ncbi:hypothetical protein STCU_01758 [Strigomonas culicis]|uniref:Uncharacterized protein n=1 Tax=Strigomonas culicis TaxID=28005 RepID=S9UZK8_9TRYP|nr:hypothetical protein STCU_01758 [Strigomonas culicis]|eukprot:EPY34213.1 hypothetical protein STCU_01758 [Strigomonas culicis]